MRRLLEDVDLSGKHARTMQRERVDNFFLMFIRTKL
jgi:hypothetical protein